MTHSASLQFINGREESVILFSHLTGQEMINQAQVYARDLVERTRGLDAAPLDRLEPSTVIVDFIRYLTSGLAQVRGNYYLGATLDHGDNHDYGHHKIDLAAMRKEVRAR